jgi:hypothetical protein
MKRAAKVLVIYLLSLLVFSLLFSWLGIKSPYLPMSTLKTVISPMMMVTAIGGIIALKYTVPLKSLKIFLLVYSFLWLFRFCMLYLANYIGEATILNKTFRFDLIIPSYYENVSRIGTPLPFIIFWFINYLFTNHHNTVEGEDDKPL